MSPHGTADGLACNAGILLWELYLLDGNAMPLVLHVMRPQLTYVLGDWNTLLHYSIVLLLSLLPSA